MLESGDFSDLKIQTNDGVVFNVHKTILSARSSVFLKMLTSNMKEAATNTVEIEDIDSKTMQEFLRFIYCEEFKDFKAVSNDLLYAAEKYEVNQLKEICIEELAANVSAENVIETLILADRINGAEKLVKDCIPIVQK
jgi:speckle-type POZ protein